MTQSLIAGSNATVGRSRDYRRIERLWRLVVLVGSARNGKTLSELREALGVSRSTIYRDLDVLQGAGVTLRQVGSRWTLGQSPSFRLAPNAIQLAALRLARQLAAPLEGSAMVAELDHMLGVSQNTAPGAAVSVSPPMGRSANAANVEALERAIVAKKRLRLKYRAASTRATTWRDVDPAALRLADTDLYLVGWDLGKEDWRTFKVVRIEVAQLRDEPSEPHGVFDEEALFGNSVRVWVADPVDIVVRLTPDVAHLVDEYPLHPSQQVSNAPDGGVVVRARVAGLHEALRWVLGWGRAAEALEPPVFRLLVAEELRAAMTPYGRGLSKKSTPGVVSRGVRRVPATTERGRSPKAEPSP